MRNIDIAIIGGGPAGLTAGLYAARAGYSPVLFESGFPGGQASTTDVLNNYPGFPGGVGGPELMGKFQEQAEDAGMKTEYASVTAIAPTEGGYLLSTDGGEQASAKAVILALGAKPRNLGVPGEQENIGRGVSYCATCDGALYRDKAVAVVGGGNTAVEDALYLSRFCESVALIHRRNELRAMGRDVERLKATKNVRLLLEETVAGIQREESGLLLKLGGGGEMRVSGLFVAVGTIPQTDIVKDLVDRDGAGYINAGEDTRTSAAGVFAAGDARQKPLRQVVTAASDGAVAANAAVAYLGDL